MPLFSPIWLYPLTYSSTPLWSSSPVYTITATGSSNIHWPLHLSSCFGWSLLWLRRSFPILQPNDSHFSWPERTFIPHEARHPFKLRSQGLLFGWWVGGISVLHAWFCLGVFFPLMNSLKCGLSELASYFVSVFWYLIFWNAQNLPFYHLHSATLWA